jgi:hypothetical protein
MALAISSQPRIADAHDQILASIAVGMASTILGSHQ